MSAVWRPFLLLAGLVLAGLALHALPEGGASKLLEQLSAEPSASSAAMLVVIGSLLCAVGVPRQIVAYAAAYAFGFWMGAALSLAAQMVGCVADFYWARLVGRKWAREKMARRWGGRLARMDDFLTANPFTATVILRLLPVGNNLAVNLLAGVSGVAAAAFMVGSAIGYVPQTVIFALLGGGARVDRATQIVVAVALFAASALAGVVLLRRHRSVVAA